MRKSYQILLGFDIIFYVSAIKENYTGSYDRISVKHLEDYEYEFKEFSLFLFVQGFQVYYYLERV